MKSIIFEGDEAKCPECGAEVKKNENGNYPGQCSSCDTELMIGGSQQTDNEFILKSKKNNPFGDDLNPNLKEAINKKKNLKVDKQVIVSSGDINKDYTVIGIVGTNVSDQKTVETNAGCMGGNATARVSVGTEGMYEKGANELFLLSKNKGGDAVIFANFEYRIALSRSGETAKQVQELFCYGTAVKFTS